MNRFDPLICSINASSGYNCTGSEMGNLFYNVLGGVAESSIAVTHNNNDLFANIIGASYCSVTEYTSNPGLAWKFNFGNRQQSLSVAENLSHSAWAVHDGDVGSAVVPVPAAMWLFGSGLLGLLGIAKRKKA